MPQCNTKIALVGNSLSKGGAEKVQARLSLLFEKLGMEVCHILVKDEITYPFAGKVFNMGLLKNRTNGPTNKLKRLQALRKFLKDEHFDFIIDFRVRKNFLQEYMIAHWVYNAPVIESVHSHQTKLYFPGPPFLAKYLYRKAHGIVAVSKEIESKIRKKYGCQNVTTIYNPLDFEEIDLKSKEKPTVDFPFILGMGRMQSNIKQFDHLIKAFAGSKAMEKGMKLVLIGEGAYRTVLEQMVLELGLDKEVVFISFLDNPYPFYRNAKCTILTSKFEGFPNTLTESLACHTPVISYDCKSGPKEIIVHEENGLLVSKNNLQELTEQIDRLIEDETLYAHCKDKARSSVQYLHPDIVMPQWLRFMGLEYPNV